MTHDEQQRFNAWQAQMFERTIAVMTFTVLTVM